MISIVLVEILKEMRALTCPCYNLKIGLPMLYTKEGEDRLAYRLIISIHKTLREK